MDVDCRRPRHDENYSSLFVENSHPETLHRDMCIACSGSSSGLRLPPLRTMPIHKIVSKERCQSYFIDGCRRIKIERNNLLCEQAPTEVFRSIFAWLVARLTCYLAGDFFRAFTTYTMAITTSARDPRKSSPEWMRKLSRGFCILN